MEPELTQNDQQFEALAAALAHASTKPSVFPLRYARQTDVFSIVEHLQVHEASSGITHVILDWRNQRVVSLDMQVEALKEQALPEGPSVWHIMGLSNSLVASKLEIFELETAEELEGEPLEQAAEEVEKDLLEQWGEELASLLSLPGSICWWETPAMWEQLVQLLPELAEQLGEGFAFESMAPPVPGAHGAAEAAPLEEAPPPRQQARALLKAGKAAEALALAREQLDIAQQRGGSTTQAQAHCLIGQAYAHQDDALQAAEAYQRALEAPTPSTATLGETYFHVANLLATLGMNELAMRWYKRLLSVEAVPEVREFIAKGHRNLAVLYINEGDVETAFDHYGHALDGLEELESWESLAHTHHQVAEVFSELRQTKDAREHLEAAATFFQQANNPYQRGMCYKQLARLVAYQGDLPRATHEYEQAIPCFDPDLHPQELMDAHKRLGDLYQDQFQWAMAEAHYEQALPLARELNDQFTVDALEDSIEQMKEKAAPPPSSKKKKGLFGGLFGS